LKNGRLWIYAARSGRIIKASIEDGGTNKPAEVLDHPILKKTMRKMYVDDFGVHCIMLFGTEVYYTNWESQTIVPIDVNGPNGHATFSCCSVLYVDDDDPNLFELVLGTDDGKIYMRPIMITSIEPAKIEWEFLEDVD
jgi:hypothetical protein